MINGYHPTTDELYLLGMAAYFGKLPLNSNRLKGLMEARGLNYADRRALWSNLYTKGIVDGVDIQRWNCQVKRENYLDVCRAVIRLYPKWESDYRKIKDYRGDTESDLWDLATAIEQKKKSEVKRLMELPWNRLNQWVSYTYVLIGDPTAWEVLMSVNEDIIRNLIGWYVNKKVRSDAFGIQESYNCHKFCEAYFSQKASNTTASLLACMDYLMLGKVEQVELPKDEFSLAMRAIKLMYGGQLDEALKDFTNSLKLRNAHSHEKNYYDNPLLCLMLVVCYIKCDTPDTRKRLQQLLNKRGVNDNAELRPVVLLARYALEGMIPTGIMSSVKSCLERNAYSPIAMGVARIVLLMTKTDLKQWKISPKQAMALSHCAIIRFEQLMMQQQESVVSGDLKNAYGTQSVLGTIRLKEEWEVVLEDVQGLLTKDTKVRKDDDRRIVYHVSTEYSRVKVKEQRRLKSGAWSMGTEVAFSSYCKGEIEAMTEKDILAAKTVAAECDYSYDIRPSMILPHMVGEDRVFLETGNGVRPLVVAEEPPYISLYPEGKLLRIESNVKLDNTSHGPDSVQVSMNGDSKIVVTRLTPQQKLLLSKLLKLTSIPVSATEQLKPLLELMAKHVEIHTPLIEGGSSLEQRKGRTTLTLRMEPQRDTFWVTPQIQPLEGGSLRLTPGEGKHVVFDEAEGVRYQITRNLKAEKQNFDLLALEGGLDVDEDGSMLEIEEMLDLLEFVQEHPDTCEMEWQEGTKYRVRKVNPSKEVNVGLVSRQNWFDIEGEVELDEGQVFSSAEFLRLMSEGLVGRRFVRLSDGEYVALTEQLTKQLQQLSILAQYDRKGAHIPRYQVGAIAEALERNGNVVKADKGFEQLKKKIQTAAKMKIAVPEQLKAELRDYQEEGFRWMVRLTEWGAGACLADDMGLGKTVQTIALMLYRAKKGATLVVCPASVIYNWKAELERFAPTLEVTLMSEVEDRKKAIVQAQKYGVVLTTYGLLVREAELMRTKKWNLVVLDEAHTIKNRSTKMSAAAMDLQSQARVILTGTPVQNYLSELWNLFQFLNPGLLGTFEHFTNRYILPIERDENKAVQTQLRHAIQPFLLRRTKAEVVEELPDKTEIIHLVEMSDDERMAYEALRLSAQEKVEEEKKMGVNVLSMITRLREAACSVSLVSKDWAGGSSKIEAFKELVGQIVMGGNRVLVFSQFTGFLAQVREALNEMKDMRYLYLDGSTPTRQRAEMVKQFQHGNVPVFLISLKAGGLGLNLTGANYVIHLDPWWNPAIEQQATDRAYRIGQHQNVTVYHLVSDHTIEQKILRLHKTKRDMADALLEGTNLGRAMTLEDLKYLVETE